MQNKTNKADLVEALAGIFFSAIFLILFNFFYKDIKFITRDFDQILPLYNFSLVLSIVLNASKLLIRSKAYKSLTQVMSNLVFFMIAFYFWTIFPFDTSVIGNKNSWDLVFRALIVLPSIAVFIATVIESIKLISGSYAQD